MPKIPPARGGGVGSKAVTWLDGGGNVNMEDGGGGGGGKSGGAGALGGGGGGGGGTPCAAIPDTGPRHNTRNTPSIVV